MSQNGLVGETLGGRYKIEEQIGEGGMSTVYKAYDPNLQRAVAVKVIHSHLAGEPRFLGRFESEATAVARLRHKNIVQVFDFSHEQDLYYMVQEFVPGETLQQRLQRLSETGREMPVGEAIRYAIDICEAAGYAHERGMIHRDIKPANIMLDVHGQAILMDFGIVKITGSTEHTVTGAVVGTALYMPPELIRGEVPDARSDIYSLGVVIYEMISGKPPFDAKSAMTLLMMHLKDPVPDLRQVRSDVPAGLMEVIRKALAKDRAERYASMADMARALQAVLAQLETAPPLHELATERDLSPQPEPDAGLHDLATEMDPGPPAGPAAAGDTQRDVPPPHSRPASGAGPTPPAAANQPRRGDAPVDAARREPSPPPPAPPAHEPRVPPPRPPAGRGVRPLWIGGALVLLAALAAVAFLLLNGGDEQTPEAGLDPGLAAGVRVTEVAPGTEPTGDADPEQPTPAVARPTPTAAMEQMPGHAAQPTPTVDLATTISLAIEGITLDDQQRYVVSYQAIGLPQVMTDTHLQFFFNTVPFQVAGSPNASWEAYYGPSPFAALTPADRPDNAGQLCVQAANADDSPLIGTGTCAPLPDVVSLTAEQDLACHFGPGEDYPAVGQLLAGEPALVLGLSEDELWWNVANPRNLEQTCWLYTLSTTVSGDISQLPLVAGPPPGAVPPAGPSVELTGISLDVENRYAVDFQVQGFEPAYPGTHIHFFFNTFSPADVGIGGEANRRAHGGGSPFTGFAAADRPGGATGLCAVVANPDHTVVPDSGNCLDLPNLPTIQLTGITVDPESRYVVDFQTQGFTPQYPGGTHIHFFFNTFSPADVGIGGEANRKSYGGASPFVAWATGERPENATGLCAVVANPDHTVLPDSGNCQPLPDLPTAEITGITLDAEGRYVVDFQPRGFTPSYPGGTHLHFYFNTFDEADVGIGGEANRKSYGEAPPFTGFAASDRPAEATQLCVVVAIPSHEVLPNSGNCYHVPDVLAVEITRITIDEQNRYSTEYVAYGFVPQDPGTHVHFFFDTVSPEQLGQGGGAHPYSHGGSSPYSGYSTADRPAAATQLCAIVVRPDGSLVENSGNCLALPDVPPGGP